MATTNFTTGTVITSEFLNDVQDAEHLSYTPTGAGAVATTVQAKLQESVSVKDFGAIGDGVTDDTSAILLAKSASKTLYFPSGIYLVSAPIPFAGSDWYIYGDGGARSRIKTTLNGDIFQIDRFAGSSTRGTIRDLGFDRVFTMPYSDSCAIRVLSDATTGGIYAWKFINLEFQHLYRCIRFGRTEKEMWLGTPSIEKHSFCEFTNLKSLASTGYEPFECISFDEGCGPHHTISGGSLFASGSGSACVKIGDGGVNNGFGDMLIYGVHMTNADYGVRLIGPTGAGIYNQNVTISNCQFDGPMTYTIAATRMQNCRFLPNNSTSSGAVTLVECSNIVFNDEQNLNFFKGVIAGHTSRLNNGVTFAAAGQFSATTGYPLDQSNWSADALGSIRMVLKSRGATKGTHTAVQSGDRIGEDRYLGSDGGAFKPGALVAVNAAATPTSGDAYIPMTYAIRTSPDAVTSPVDRVIVDEAGNVAIGGAGVSTSTTAVNGYVYLQKCLGAPTGVPAKSYNGKIPVLIDETNSKLWAHIGGAWKYIQFL